MDGWNSNHWENKEDFDYIDYSKLENYFRTNITIVTTNLVESEHIAEDGSIVGGGARVRQLVKESKVYHKEDSTFLLERIAPSLTRLSVFSPSRNRANEVLESILKEAEIKS